MSMKKMVNTVMVLAMVFSAVSPGFGGFVNIANAETTTATPVQIGSDNVISSFILSGNDGVITLNSIVITVPSGTDVSALAPTIAFTGASISPASGVAQDFNNPVTYTVTAEDGSATVYTVIVNFAEASAQATLTVEKNNFVGDSVVNPGAIHALVGSYKIAVNDLEDVRLENIKVGFSQNSVYDNISLEDVAGNMIGEIGYQSPDGSVAFSGLNYVLTKSQTKIINIRADILPFATGRIVSTLGDMQATGNTSGTSITTPLSVTGQTVTVVIIGEDGTQGGVSKQEYDALVALYNSTDGDNWTNHIGWFDPNVPVSEWYGVAVENGKVVTINLMQNELSGSLPPEIGDLINLTNLFLSDNDLGGSIPKEIGKLANLETLQLDHWRSPQKYLSGNLPLELFNLTNLQYLNLGWNKFDGEIPADIGNLKNLKTLMFFSNEFTGIIPKEIGSLTNLQHLSIASNKLEGTIPEELYNLTNLTDIGLGWNKLGGEISAGIGKLINLNSLNLGANKFSGQLPQEIGNLSKLETLYLSSNQFSGDFPKEIGLLKNLSYLDAQQNSFTESIPEEVFDLVNLGHLNLRLNNFEGKISKKIGQLSELRTLYLSYNKLSGEIPSEIGNLSNLRYLELYENLLTGQLPAEIEKLQNLTNLDVGRNQLSGNIPDEIGNLSLLSEFRAGSNKLSGSIPSSIGNLTNLRSLELFENKLSGQLPAEMSNMQNLDNLLLWENKITGKIPTEFAKLKKLSSAILYNNQIDEVPDEISTMEGLWNLNLVGNLLSYIPDFSNNATLTQLQVNDNALTFEDLESNMSKFGHYSWYSPQAKINVEPNEVKLIVGDTLTLDVTVGGTANKYQWFQDGVAVSEISSTSSYVKEHITKMGFGEYECQITNDIVKGLTLVSASIEVKNAAPLQNHAPVAADDQIMVYKNNGLLFSIFDNDIDEDGDPLSLQSTTEPAHGQIEWASPFPNGNLLYTAEKDYIGSDSFDYTVSDERGGFDTATVMITVKELFPPIVLDDIAITDENIAVTINVFDNDSDPNGGILDIKEVSNPAHGSAVINSSSIIYTPSSNYFGIDTFTYSVPFGKGDSVSATVTVIVGKVLHKKGADNALISLEARIDYQCPYSMQFQSTLNKVLDEYQEKVNFYIKHFPLSAMHPNAWKAAEAAECANDQGDDHFWQMNDWFVSKAADFTIDGVKNFAVTLSHFDPQLFNSCLDSGSKHLVIQEYINSGSDTTGTPTTYVRRKSDGQFKKVEGAVSYEDLKKVIDSLIQIFAVPGVPNIEPVDPINVSTSTLYKVIIDPGENSTSSEKTTFSVRLRLRDESTPCIDEFAAPCEEDAGVVYMQDDGSWGDIPVWFTYDQLGGLSGKIMKNLVGDNRYFISVATRNSDGNETAYGATMQFSLVWTVPPEPITLSDITTSSVTLNWSSGGGTEHRFIVQQWNDFDALNPADAIPYQVLAIIPVSAQTTLYSYTISGLTPNTTYNEYYWLIAAQDHVSASYAHSPSFKTLSLPDTTQLVVTPPSNGGSSGGGGGGGGGSIQAPAFIAPVVGGFSVVINSGAAETNSANVNLTLSGGAAARMAISNSSDFGNISQETYQATRAWKLSDGFSEKTIFVKFFDQNGTVSPVVLATIKFVSVTTVTPTIQTPTQAPTGQVLGVKITRTDELIAKLKFGQRGTEVNELQNELKRLGFLAKSYKTTYYYGNITATGVAKYKASKKQVLGVKMVNIESLIAAVKFGERSNNVKLLQGELKKAGFCPKGWIPTNYYGKVTKAAVEKYLASKK